MAGASEESSAGGRVLRVPVEALRVGEWALDEGASNYVSRVRRKAAGAWIELFNPVSSLVGLAQIVSSSRCEVIVRVEAVSSAPSTSLPLTLVVALGKHDKPDQAVVNATALGARAVHFLAAERSIVRELSLSRSGRLHQLSVATARQCGRSDLVRLAGPQTLDECLKELNVDHIFVCALAEPTVPLLEAIAPLGPAESAAVLVGPEGGFSESEIALALARGAVPVGLGPLVLRTELAVTVTLSAFRLQAETLK